MTIINIVTGVVILILAAILAVSVDRGFWNAVDRVALALHRAAVRARIRQSFIEAKLNDSWRRGEPWRDA